MDPVLKPRQLRVALAVFETGSALRAAERVGLSAPAALGALSGLEAALGEALFTRTARGMAPTRAGTLFCPRIAAALAELKAAETALHAKRTFALHLDHVHLRALAALLEAESAAAAARALGLAQPSLLRTARELEALAGVPLWERHGRGLGPNWQARLLGQYAGRLHAELRLGLDELAEARGGRAGRLLVGALPLARTAWLPAALIATLALYPEAEMDILDGPYDEQRAALLSGRTDAILGPLRPPTPELEQEELFADPLGIMVRPGHWFTGGAGLDRLDWILPPTGTPSRRAFDDFLAAQGHPPPPRVIGCNSLITIRALLAATDHAAVLSTRQVAGDLAAGTLRMAGPALPGTAQPVGLAWRAGYRPSGLGEAFLQAARLTAPLHG